MPFGSGDQQTLYCLMIMTRRKESGVIDEIGEVVDDVEQCWQCEAGKVSKYKEAMGEVWMGWDGWMDGVDNSYEWGERCTTKVATENRYQS